MPYTVYRADFTTKLKTKGSWWGYSGNIDLRADRIGVLSADWCRCMQRQTLDVKPVIVDLKTPQVALLIEAQLAAKSILARPTHVRSSCEIRQSELVPFFCTGFNLAKIHVVCNWIMNIDNYDRMSV